MADKLYPPPPPPTAPPYETQPYPPLPPPINSPHPHPIRVSTSSERSERPKSDNSFTEKVVTSLSAGLFSLLTISLSYTAVFPSSEIFRATIAPLVSSTVFLVIAIVSALFLCTTPGRFAKFAILPIAFATVSGAMIILLNVSSKALSEGGFVSLNFLAVLLSAGVFGGLALGCTIAFLLIDAF